MANNELPHVTVASVICDNNRFLMVQEMQSNSIVYNQPAGHLENGETLIEGAIRETLEETGWHVKISAFLGISQYNSPNNITFVRVSFVAEPLHFDSHIKRDSDIIDTAWKSYEDIKAIEHQLRSPLVLNDIEKYRRGDRFPLDLVQGFLQATL